MKYFYHFICILIAFLLQTTLFSYVTFFDAKPMLALIVVVCTAQAYGYFDGTIAGLMAGLMLDILGGKGIGINALLFMYIGTVVGITSRDFFKEKPTVAVFFTIAANLCYELAYYFFTFFIWGETRVFSAFFMIILPEILYTAVFSAPIFMLIKRFSKRALEK